MTPAHENEKHDEWEHGDQIIEHIPELPRYFKAAESLSKPHNKE